jgi:hypothetical protein
VIYTTTGDEDGQNFGNIHECDPCTKTVSAYLEEVQAFLDANAIAEDMF